MKLIYFCRVKLKLVLSLCLYLWTAISYAATPALPAPAFPTPAFSTKLASQFLLTDITQTDTHLVTVGERGHILYSTDGETWQQAKVPVNVLLTSVVFKNNDLGFATGHDATLLKTQDGGLNWQIVNYQPELDKPLLDVALFGDSVVAVGAYGLYWQSNDNGQTWHDQFHEELLLPEDQEYLADIKEYEPEFYDDEKQFLLPHFNAVTLTQGAWYLAGEAGFAAVSVNQGQDWQALQSDYYGSYFSVFVPNEKLIVLAGLRGHLFKSADKGESWQQINTAANATINNSLGHGQSHFFFANSGNLFYHLADGVMRHHVFADGKALMSGVVFNDKLILATESGIKSVQLVKLK